MFVFLIQISSYYKMLRDILKQKKQKCPEKTIGLRFIFCLISCMGIPTGAIEGVFEFCLWGLYLTIFEPPEEPLEVPQGSPISRPQERNWKIPLIAPVGSPIQLIEQNIGPL